MTSVLKRVWIALVPVVVLAVSGLVVGRLHKVFASQDLQVEVLKFKSATLAAQAAPPAARLVNVAADLRLHWPQALRRAGHDPASPIAWYAEGSND
jgi:hypothetical protein